MKIFKSSLKIFDFTPIGSLRSRTEFRAGNWQKNNISHVYVSIEED